MAFVIPQNNANPSLNGLFVEIDDKELKMTATDGHCLAQVKTKKYTLGEEKKWLLPRRAIFELRKLLEVVPEGSEVFVGTCGNQLVFSGGIFNFFTKLLADSFPKYQTIMDKKNFMPASVDRQSFIKTLRRSTCLLSGQFIATRFEFEKDSVSVSLQNNEVGTLKEELAISGFEKEGVDIRFYAPYLLSGLQVLPAEKVNFFLHNPAKPIIFEAEQADASMTYLVMPVSPTSGS